MWEKAEQTGTILKSELYNNLAVLKIYFNQLPQAEIFLEKACEIHQKNIDSESIY